MLQAKGLCKQFKNFLAVDHLDLEVGKGEIVGLLGPNGAGKTTTLRSLCGILRPNAGSVTINGFDLQSDQARAKQGLAFVPEVPALYDMLTVQEHLKFIAMCFSKLDVYDRFHEELLVRYSLWDKRTELVGTLSKGMRQKLSVACALVHEANVFLFDEPIIGIDPSGVHQFKMELLRLKEQGASILISTHMLDTAEKFCDRVAIMSKGRLIAFGSLAELQMIGGMEKKSLEDLFLAITGDSPAPVETPMPPGVMPPVVIQAPADPAPDSTDSTTPADSTPPAEPSTPAEPSLPAEPSPPAEPSTPAE